MKVKLAIVFIFVNVSFGWSLSGLFKPVEKGALKESYEVGEIAIRSFSKNIDEILQYAVERGRISGVDKYKLHTLYSKWNTGGIFLAKCLKVEGCNPYEFYKKVHNQPPLYKNIYLKYPTLSVEQLRLKVGKVNEIIMDKYFIKSGWKKIEGEVGRNGIDGLYVKYDRGNIKDVMLVEAKYGKAQLNRKTNQMSKEWSLKKIDELIKKYPNNPEYKIIKKRIEQGNYRARLWKMKEEDGKLVIDLKKIKSDSSDVVVENLTGGEKTKINYKDNVIIDLNNPKSPFHKEVANWYKEAIDEI